ncbi:hypothetical protein FB565_008398 [Actinoplanes lutulentus]|uniref:Uncharacterized protein n=1 Tax=Actinoplanes lutulentus TaxID=1287878 RepID=A0A327Z290_9ACTN|nr:hypothetical protein [Actinoplanes lutulentus]MBB2948615.1 hypothetical protein [Actinoplanes lutulentus]RAK28014.1 hypothetical protein B0I29_121110 [Actinoplanes lutulentus]
MGDLVHVVVAAGAVDHLRVPPLSIVDGSPDVEWVGLPSGWWRYARRPLLRLPLDPASAARERRAARFFPVTVLVAVVWMLAALEGFVWADPFLGISRGTWIWIRLAALLVFFAWMQVYFRWRVVQRPVRAAGHLIRISGVPRAVAQQWAELNPESVRVVEQWVAVRRFRPRVYAAWGSACLGGGAAMFIVGGDSLWFVFIGLGLLVAGVVLLFKTLPPRYIRFEPVE